MLICENQLYQCHLRSIKNKTEDRRAKKEDDNHRVSLSCTGYHGVPKKPYFLS